MKIALYIEDGLEQIVLTPETKTEDGILDKLHERQRELSVLKGSFFECRGGWVRQSGDKASTMIVLRPAIVDAMLGTKPAGLSREAVAARAAGIAQKEPSHD